MYGNISNWLLTIFTFRVLDLKVQFHRYFPFIKPVNIIFNDVLCLINVSKMDNQIRNSIWNII